MKNYILSFLVLFLLSAFFISGCGTQTVTPGSPLSGSSWCTPGASWSYAGTTDQGEAVKASWIMKGIEPFKEDNYCHVTLSSTETEQSETVIEYYFKQTDNKNSDVWMVTKDKTGKVLMEYHVTGTS